MMDLLRLCLEPVFQRRRTLWRLLGAACVLTGFAVLYWVLGRLGCAGGWTPLFLVGAMVLVFLGWERSVQPVDWSAIARRVEARHPDLHTLLLTAVEQRPDSETGQLSYLQQRVIAEAVVECRKRDLAGVVPGWHLGLARIGFGIGLGVFFFALFRVEDLGRNPSRPGAKAPPLQAETVVVEPGNAEAERGSDIVVLARFRIPGPAAAKVLTRVEGGKEGGSELPLSKSLGDPVYGGTLRTVERDLIYWVEFDGEKSGEFRLRVFEYPRLERADAVLRFPTYAGLPQREEPDVRRVTALEGSHVDIRFQLNKAVAKAVLVAKDGGKIPLETDGVRPEALLRGFELRASQSYELRLEDAEGRAGKLAEKFAFEALKNRRPDLRAEAPHGDQRFSPIEEVEFRGRVTDDFGLLRYGLSVAFGAGEAEEIVIGERAPGVKPVSLSHTLRLEERRVNPDEWMSWHLWAEDLGEDGKVRRTQSDVYFGEIRPFEEVFRKAPPDEGQEAPQGNKVRELLDLERKVISATWNLKRQVGELPEHARPGESYPRDEQVVRESQAAIFEGIREVLDSAQNPQAREAAGRALNAMQEAVTHLQSAEKDAELLEAALRAENAAQSALLKLVAHEYAMSRARGQSGKDGAQDPARRQMDELEMKPEAERYEKQKEAAMAESELRKEQLAVFNRLKELAQRQNDINRQVQELQNALAAAKDEGEREEVRRRLKRLREEEQQLLADLDELRQKMESSPEAGQMAEQREQLERSRSDAQQAAAALGQEQASRALASGARAERRLGELRNSLKKEVGGQFREELREMRQDARALSERQEALSRAMQEPAREGGRLSLGDRAKPLDLSDKISEQRERLEELKHKIKAVSEEAEQSEPLLSKQLEDALRESVLAGTEGKLDQARELIRRGLGTQARGYGEQVRSELEGMREGVERAAQRILGDEVESLKAARAELDAAVSALEGGAKGRAEKRDADAEQGAGGKAGMAEAGGKKGGTDGKGRIASGRNGEVHPGSVAGGERVEGRAEGGDGGPLTGAGFGDWMDRLRNVEEMLEDPGLRAEAARIRDAAKGVRGEYKRQGVLPKRELVQSQIGSPLVDLRRRVEEVLVRKASRENLAPIDRDAVPAKYAERVRRYYEELSKP
jgi:hypothetical protein